ncbi:hypothetical protein IE81DRAFT_321821 [Ceraceosorus guamensis]|uniref:Cytochrome c oxidase assembly protein COX20, mitochondrial n=1 Tax=Ceraceosorus guamensis TaxID=1522189 RepID=A0A316W5C1_9BASI|nr:hypothetical protein IE81DRAFT_321821 [Ceraceosorus guamensis]PWN43911.1 hypothetical protein IE81DRAFT_321821 [Ceraceosorus guamensis]
MSDPSSSTSSSTSSGPSNRNPTHVLPASKPEQQQQAGVGEALKSFRPAQAANRLSSGRVHCAKQSLLLGTATAAGVGGISALAGRGPKRSLNWGIGAWFLITISSWELCRRSRAAEAQRMKIAIEAFSKKRAAAAGTSGGAGGTSAPSSQR